jgi:hypothetical protein
MSSLLRGRLFDSRLLGQGSRSHLLRRHPATWILPLAFLVANLGALWLYGARFSDRVTSLRGQIEAEDAELAAVAEQRRRLEELVSIARSSSDGVAVLYSESFATEAERITALIREVKELARRAELREAESIGYPSAEVEDWGLIQRDIVFTVSGTYPQLRTFVNLLELSPSFVVLRGVRLDDSQSELTIGLTLSTLFTGRDRKAST